MKSNGDIELVPTKDIVRSPYQCREDFEEQSILELAANIKEHGLLQPIVVRKHKSKYELVCGERRLLAFRRNKEEQIPAIVRDYSDKQARLACLSENVQRMDLSKVEEIEAVANWVDAWLDEHCKDYRDFLGKTYFGKESKRWTASALDLDKSVDRAAMVFRILATDVEKKTQHLEDKFVCEINSALDAIHKDINPYTFANHDMPLLRRLDLCPTHVKQAAVRKRLNKAQTKALTDLAITDPELAKNAVEQGIFGVPIEEASAKEIFLHRHQSDNLKSPTLLERAKASPIGMQNANIAIDYLAAIPEDDPERSKAFRHVAAWIEKQQTAMSDNRKQR